eukprot:2263966-Prymnesium_polylepis.1
MRRMSAAIALIGLLCLILQRTCEGHDLRLVTQPIPANVLEKMPVRPRVVLFLHYAKCGGTTVRNIFHMQKWSATYWSSSQRFYGWKANRILDGIRHFLMQNKTRIFVEWHLGTELLDVPHIRDSVRMIRPDTEFIAFTIFREPASMVASIGTYFNPSTPPMVYLLQGQETLLKWVSHDPAITGTVAVDTEGNDRVDA